MSYTLITENGRVFSCATISAVIDNYQRSGASTNTTIKSITKDPPTHVLSEFEKIHKYMRMYGSSFTQPNNIIMDDPYKDEKVTIKKEDLLKRLQDMETRMDNQLYRIKAVESSKINHATRLIILERQQNETSEKLNALEDEE